MILRRLYELARRENLLEDPAFVQAEVSCLIPIGRDGRWLGTLHDVRRQQEIPAKQKGAKPKVKLVGGKPLPVPVRPVIWDEVKGNWKTTDPASSGKEKPAVFLADTIARVLPVESLIEGCDLRLMPAVSDMSGLPAEGKNLIILAAVEDVLHIRVFDRDGRRIVEGSENVPKAKTEDLKTQLESLWPPHELTASEKERLITVVTSMVGLTLIDEKDRAKLQAQRSTFWRFLRYAAKQTSDPALLALLRFWEECQTSAGLRERLAAEVDRNKLSISDLCTFTWEPDRGCTVLDRDPNPACTWWRKFFSSDFESQQEGLIRGPCQVTGEITSLAPSIKSKINGLIPIGCRAEAYLVTGLPAAESYDLRGVVSGMVSQRGVDGFTRALNTLIANELPNPHDRSQPGGIRSSIRAGKVLFLFWTREPADTGFMNVLDQPEPDQVTELIESPRKGQESRSLDDENNFFCLSLSGNSARIVVRDYLEAPIPEVKASIGRWFHDLRIAGTGKDDWGQPTSRFPLWMLVGATAADMDSVAPDVPSQLMRAALQGRSYPLPDSILASCLNRLRAEGSDGFSPARMALIKLFLLRRNHPVTEQLQTDDKPAAYYCGCLLALFEEIQYAALGDVNATVVDKFFSGFCSAPGSLLGMLFDHTMKHMGKLRSEKPKAHGALERRLAELSVKLQSPPRGQLSMEGQGWLALGYYHQKAERFKRIAGHKAKKQAGAGLTTATDPAATASDA